MKSKSIAFRPKLQLPVALVCLLLPAGGAMAGEGLTPFQPGSSTGIPVGALPPPGIYATLDNEYAYGEYANNNGDPVPIKISNSVETAIVEWSTPFHILGAHYGMLLIQPTSFQNVDTKGVGGHVTDSDGFFNTIFAPIQLSWKLPDNFFVSISQTIYFRNGEFHEANGRRVQSSYANAYYTFEPGFAVSYLKDGWDLTTNNVYDINLKNQKTNYSSGNIYYNDFTATKLIGKWTLGGIGDWTIQTGPDYQSGIKLPDGGDRVEHVLAGPLIGYHYGRYQITLRYLQNIMTRNDIAVSFLHVGVSTSF